MPSVTGPLRPAAQVQQALQPQSSCEGLEAIGATGTGQCAPEVDFGALQSLDPTERDAALSRFLKDQATEIAGSVALGNGFVQDALIAASALDSDLFWWRDSAIASGAKLLTAAASAEDHLIAAVDQGNAAQLPDHLLPEDGSCGIDDGSAGAAWCEHQAVSSDARTGLDDWFSLPEALDSELENTLGELSQPSSQRVRPQLKERVKSVLELYEDGNYVGSMSEKLLAANLGRGDQDVFAKAVFDKVAPGWNKGELNYLSEFVEAQDIALQAWFNAKLGVETSPTYGYDNEQDGVCEGTQAGALAFDIASKRQQKERHERSMLELGEADSLSDESFATRAAKAIGAFLVQEGDSAKLHLMFAIPVLGANGKARFTLDAKGLRRRGQTVLSAEVTMGGMAKFGPMYAAAGILGTAKGSGDDAGEAFRLMMLGVERMLDDLMGDEDSGMFDEGYEEALLDGMDGNDFAEYALGGFIEGGLQRTETSATAGSTRVSGAQGVRVARPKGGNIKQTGFRDLQGKFSVITKDALGHGQATGRWVDGEWQSVSFDVAAGVNLTPEKAERMELDSFARNAIGGMVDMVNRWETGDTSAQAHLGQLALKVTDLDGRAAKAVQKNFGNSPMQGARVQFELGVRGKLTANKSDLTVYVVEKTVYRTETHAGLEGEAAVSFGDTIWDWDVSV